MEFCADILSKDTWAGAAETYEMMIRRIPFISNMRWA